MKSLKKKLVKTLVGVGLGSIGIVGGLKLADPLIDRAVAPARDYLSMKIDIPDVKGQIDENMPQEDRERFEQLLDAMAKTPHGRQLLRTLGKEGTMLSVVDSFKNEKIKGQATGTEKIEIKRGCLHSVDGIWALSHEAGHVQNNANFSGITRTLDDAHIVNTIDEALAERIAFLVVQETKKMIPNFMTEEEYYKVLEYWGYDFLKDCGLAVKRAGAQAVFSKRMKNTDYGKEHTKAYEKQSLDANLNNGKRFLYTDDRVLDRDPDWNKVVKQMSGGEVRSIPGLPEVSWPFIRYMVDFQYLSGGCIEGVDLSCARRYKRELLQGNGFKLEILDQLSSLLTVNLLLNVENKRPVVDFFKEVIPEQWSQNLREDRLPPSLLSEQGRQLAGKFLEEKTNLEYLNDTLKVLNNPALSETLKKEGISTSGLREAVFILNTYQHVFFKEEGKSIIPNNPKALQNVHL